MRFLCLVYGWDREAARAAGGVAGGAELRPASTATTVRVRGGRTEISDGPFADAAEQLDGYVVLECADLDEALGLARRIPAAAAVEVRPQYVEVGAAA